MSDHGKAVFLSYASQDAAAAQRICEALRAAGVEVWFDQNELVGGDAWDAKIRKQIAECALFVPIISANTQARGEGYFRIEWRLAAQRTHAMAEDQAFLLPVVIDQTRDAEARVPSEFKAVQWTRFAGGETPGAFCERVKKLLGGSEMNPAVGGALCPDPAVRPVGSRRKAAPTARPSEFRRWLIPAFVAVGVVVALAIWQPWKTAAPPPAAVASEAQRLTQQARAALEDPLATRENLRFAEELARKAVAADVTDGVAVAVQARVALAFINDRYDTSPERQQSARTQAERALRLAPDSPEAVLAYVVYLNVSGQFAEAEKRTGEAVSRHPNEARLLREQARALQGLQRFAEATAKIERAAALPGGDAEALTMEAERLFWNLQIAEADRLLDRALAQNPTKRTYETKLRLLLWGWGDVAAAREIISRLPASLQLEDVFTVYAASVWRRLGDIDKAMDTLRRVPRDFLEDSVVSAPKAIYAAATLFPESRPAAFQLEATQALALLDRRLTVEPNRGDWIFWRAMLLAMLGRPDEARRGLALYEQLGHRLGRGRQFRMRFLLGETEAAIAEAERSIRVRDIDALFTFHDLRAEPLYREIRKDPRMVAVLAEGETWLAELRGGPKTLVTVPGSAPEKSVAVLAFANLADDKANEYFSDGISEELLNVLAKVPGLKVSARTSAFSFKGKNVPIPEIAKQLGVAYVVEGSVRKAGSQVRITAQLIKAADGFHVWSDTFTRELKDVFAVQDEIAGLIAKNLSLQLGASSAAAVAGAVNPEAYRLYLEGRAAWNRRDAAGFSQAEQLFNRVLELEPRFARAHAALADVWTVRAAPLSGSYSQRQSPLQLRIIAKGEQAVVLDGNSAEAHASLGHALGQAWRFAEARRELGRAVELNPNYASAHQWLGRLLHSQGQLDEGLAALRRAAELDPLSHRILDNYSDALANAGRIEEAWVVLGRAIALHPSGVQIRCKQAQLLARLGRRAEALAAARALAADVGAEEPDYRFSTAVGVFSALGEAAEAEAMLRRIAPDSEDLPVALAFAGRTGELFQQLDNMTINWVENIWFDPMLAPVRAEPVFRGWTKRVGLAEALARAEAWRAANPAGKATK